eukprot:TRINITY_DN32666_c0_g4_i1.p1 TRINITY_DN32666_c0_g4~~TRINITY_DN32666_c0_g4_i1.p1  ORF type:complete len:886 (+),score=205.61 TRINITY_DN32666_c0_g4_i1:166-2823(+)
MTTCAPDGEQEVCLQGEKDVEKDVVGASGSTLESVHPSASPARSSVSNGCGATVGSIGSVGADVRAGERPVTLARVIELIRSEQLWWSEAVNRQVRRLEQSCASSVLQTTEVRRSLEQHAVSNMRLMIGELEERLVRRMQEDGLQQRLEVGGFLELQQDKLIEWTERWQERISRIEQAFVVATGSATRPADGAGGKAPGSPAQVAAEGPRQEAEARVVGGKGEAEADGESKPSWDEPATDSPADKPQSCHAPSSPGVADEGATLPLERLAALERSLATEREERTTEAAGAVRSMLAEISRLHSLQDASGGSLAVLEEKFRNLEKRIEDDMSRAKEAQVADVKSLTEALERGLKKRCDEKLEAVRLELKAAVGQRSEEVLSKTLLDSLQLQASGAFAIDNTARAPDPLDVAVAEVLRSPVPAATKGDMMTMPAGSLASDSQRARRGSMPAATSGNEAVLLAKTCRSLQVSPLRSVRPTRTSAASSSTGAVLASPISSKQHMRQVSGSLFSLPTSSDSWQAPAKTTVLPASQGMLLPRQATSHGDSSAAAAAACMEVPSQILGTRDLATGTATPSAARWIPPAASATATPPTATVRCPSLPPDAALLTPSRLREAVQADVSSVVEEPPMSSRPFAFPLGGQLPSTPQGVVASMMPASGPSTSSTAPAAVAPLPLAVAGTPHQRPQTPAGKSPVSTMHAGSVALSVATAANAWPPQAPGVVGTGPAPYPFAASGVSRSVRNVASPTRQHATYSPRLTYREAAHQFSGQLPSAAPAAGSAGLLQTPSKGVGAAVAKAAMSPVALQSLASPVPTGLPLSKTINPPGTTSISQPASSLSAAASPSPWTRRSESPRGKVQAPPGPAGVLPVSMGALANLPLGFPTFGAEPRK